MPGDELDVLLVEDNPGDVRLIEELLEETTGGSGARARNVTHADSLAEGLAVVETGAVDVVLLDLGLPDSTGIETLEAVRDESRETPIVVLTGLDDERIGDQAVQRGAQEYLVKDELTPMLLDRSLRHAIERKRFQRTQTALHRASRELIQAESRAEVCRLAVDTAADVLDRPGIGIYLFDDSANELRAVASTDYVEEIFGELPSFGPDETSITWQTFIGGETATLGDVNASEDAYRRDTPVESGIWIPLGDHGVLVVLSEDDGGFDQQSQQLADHLAATTEATLDRVEREESLHDSERELAQQNRRLETLNRMNEIIREIDQALVQATTRESIEEAVCDRLTREDRFAFAWIGETVDDRVEPRTWAGADRGYLDAVSLVTDGGEGSPAVTATVSGTPTLEPNVAANLRGAPWRKAALGRDLQSAISIPLTYNELSYGVLTVFGGEPKAFDARSRDVFAELGETIANAMNSVETRQALLTDTLVELELLVRQSDDVLSKLAREADCRIEYGGMVPESDGTARLFLGTSGATASEILAVAEDVPSVKGLAQIGEDDGESGEQRFELTVSGPTVASTIVECGAAARSIGVTGSEIEAVVELPETTDVRTFIDRFEESYPETELVARRDKERTNETRQAFESALTGKLTARQLETLQTAYYSGYFEWPRDRTGEEVAASLDITQPTFNGHLRSAERKLCALLFEGSSSATE